jgi:hypothetical protein
MPVTTYQTTRHNIPEGSTLHSNRGENLKSHARLILSAPKCFSSFPIFLNEVDKCTKNNCLPYTVK